jgi:outer membrane protein OmpA-like peptidoglycan-associated protein
MKISSKTRGPRLPSILLGALVSVALLGCATTTLSRQDVIGQYETVAKLSSALEDARAREGALLAPTHFRQTERQLDEALSAARDAEKSRANAAARQGLRTVPALTKAMEENRQVMAEVVDIRGRAAAQGAAVLFKESFGKADAAFRSASAQIESGELDDARKARPALMARYARLELLALKKGTVATAKKAIAQAKDGGADDYAPSTFAHAREELKLALSILDADRTQVDKGNEHAQRATWLARRSHVITDLIKSFKARDLSDEGRILWYQQQLHKVAKVMRDTGLPFDRSNAVVIAALRADALALKLVIKDTRVANQVAAMQLRRLEARVVGQRKGHETELKQLLVSHEKQLAAMNSGNAVRLRRAKKDASQQVATLKQRLSAQALAQAELQRMRKRGKQRFESVQRLFAAREAEVFRKGEDVLIRLKGFGFKPGKREVEARNYPLLNKIVTAIGTFPGSTVTITGHTDNRGRESNNLDLSEARARSVVSFLSTVGRVAVSRLTAAGKGEKQPVASNGTAAGRAKNRRIDILIINGKPAFRVSSATR